MFSAIILAGGRSSRLGRTKALATLAGIPLIEHVYNRVVDLVEETLIVVDTPTQFSMFENTLPEVRCVADDPHSVGPLSGVRAGLRMCSGNLIAVLACDLPFVSPAVLRHLFDACKNRSAAVPIWPNGYIEPLHAIYKRDLSLLAAEQALNEGVSSLRAMLGLLQDVVYESTERLRALDPELLTFFNINSEADLKRAEQIIRSKRSQSK